MAYKKINVKGREIELKASAATPVIYHRIFKADLIKYFQNAAKRTEKEIEEDTSSIDVLSKLGFVMAMQAKVKKLSDFGKINEDNYVEWLDEFDSIDDIPYADIMDVYNNNETTEVDEKKEAAE